MATFTARALQGETLDALVWRVLGRGAGTVERVLDLNPGIAALGAILPEGHRVTLPTIIAATTQRRETVKLWD